MHKWQMTNAIFSVFLTPFLPLVSTKFVQSPFLWSVFEQPPQCRRHMYFHRPYGGAVSGPICLPINVAPINTRQNFHATLRGWQRKTWKEWRMPCVFYRKPSVALAEKIWRNRFPDPDSLEDDHNKRIRIQKYPENGDYGRGPKHIGAENSRFSGLVVSHVIESRHGLDT